MSKVITVFTLFLSTLLSQGQGGFDRAKLDPVPIELLTRNLATQMNRGMPKMLDDYTQAVEVAHRAKEIIVYKVVNSKSDYHKKMWENEKEEYKNSLNGNDEQITCNDALMRYLIVDRGLTIKNSFYTIEKEFLFEHTVDKKACKALKQ